MERGEGIVRAICVSAERGIRKACVETAEIALGWGIAGDAHGGDWHRQVSLLSYRKIAEFNERGANVEFGDFGENLVVEGIEIEALPVGASLRIGEAVLEITQIGKRCHTRCAIFDRMGDCIMPREGAFARVLHGGAIAVGEGVRVLPPADPRLRAAVVTVSDKGSRGERIDESGPLACELLTAEGYLVVEERIVPDERPEIAEALIDLCDRRRARLVVTTGGTGFSRRDVTPEATLDVAERAAPGIAEAIRAHSMGITPRAMLGRGVSAIRGGALIVNLPGSPKAVGESLRFVLPHLGHGLAVLSGEASECAAIGPDDPDR